MTTLARLPLLLLAALVSFVAGGAEAPWASSARAKPRLGDLPIGWSVAHADVNDDGYSDLIVGAPAAKCQKACRLSRGDVT